MKISREKAISELKKEGFMWIPGSYHYVEGFKDKGEYSEWHIFMSCNQKLLASFDTAEEVVEYMQKEYGVEIEYSEEEVEAQEKNITEAVERKNKQTKGEDPQLSAAVYAMSKIDQLKEMISEIKETENLYVRGFSGEFNYESRDILPADQFCEMTKDEIEDHIFDQIDNCGYAIVSDDCSEIEIEYKGVNAIHAESIDYAEAMTLDHEKLCIFRGQEVGGNYFNDGVIVEIDEILAIILKEKAMKDAKKILQKIKKLRDTIKIKKPLSNKEIKEAINEGRK